MTDFALPPVPPPPAFAVVPVKSAWLSKINWTQIVSIVAMVIAFATSNKFQIDVNQQAAIVVVIGVIGNGLTLVLKTWFTPTVTPASLPTVAPANAMVLPQGVTLPVGTAVPLASGGVAKVVG
jgi:hypothetical protein